MYRIPSRICDVVEPWARLSPDSPALVEATGTWTYGQLDVVTRETQTWLRGLGIRPGDRVMIVGENCRAFVAILLAAASLDAWPVLVNARLSAREVDEIRDHCGARRVLYTTGISAHASDHAARHGATVGVHHGFPGAIGVGPLNATVEPERISEDITNRVAAVIYTSGTTGLPKGVMLTHRNLLFMAAGSVRVRAVTSKDRVYGVLPMSHAVGLAVVLLGTLLAGSSVYLTWRFDPMSARVILEKDGLTLLYGTPAIFNQWLQYAKLRKVSSLNFPALRVITSSGAPLDPVTKSGTESLFGMVLHNGYGITECSPTISLTRPEAPRTDISVGSVFPGVEIRLIGSDRQPVPAGEIGELHVRGPNIMKGYYRAPEETAAVIDTDGWFNTHDLARLENGSLFIVGRTKDLIVRRGFNVYPAEVEAVLNGHPAVVCSAVIGRAIKGDEEVIAFVQLLPDVSLTPSDLADYSAQHLAAYKRPSQILIVSAMPTTPTGKIAKAELKKVAENQFGGHAPIPATCS
jgi:acyl-CoA synthetase (AMP-forming)/AMP-acid ligase II